MAERFDAERAQCLVFVFKEGLLSPVAHDLKLKVGGLRIDVGDDLSIRATFDVASIVVVCARRDGKDDGAALSTADKEKIQKNMLEDVLDARAYPVVRFDSAGAGGVEREGDGYRIRGELRLHGMTRTISFTTRAEGDKRVAEVTLNQPDYRIRPYRAMLGALKIQPQVRVRVEVPRTA